MSVPVRTRLLGSLRPAAGPRRVGPAVLGLLLSVAVHPGAHAQPTSTASTSTAAQDPSTGPTDADILIRLDRVDVEDQRRRAVLSRRLNVLEARFESASDRFAELERELQELAARRAELASRPPDPPDEAAPPKRPRQRRKRASEPTPPEPTAEALEDLRRRQTTLQHERGYVRRELDLLLQSRRAISQQLEVLDLKTQRKKEARDFLTDSGSPPVAPKSAREGGPTLIRDRLVAEAERAVDRALAEVHRLERRAWLTDQLTSLDQEELRLVRSAIRPAREQEALLEQEGETLTQDLDALAEAGSDRRTLRSLRRRIFRLRQLAEEARETAAEDETTAAELSDRLEGLAQVRAPIEGRLEAAEQRVESAQRYLGFISGPFAPHRLVRWVRSSGPRILAYLVVLVVTWLLFRGLARRVFGQLVRRSHSVSEAERQDRIDTIHRTATNGARILLVSAGLLLVLPEFGVDVKVLLGSAAVFSLALAFGAQSLIKDYFSGFMVLLEDQYRVGNVVTINGRTGTVEDMSLRLTTLRSLDGAAHFVPHGEIGVVTNLTHHWSRAMLDVAVAYEEDLDRVMKVLTELAEELAQDEEFGPLVQGPPTMLGVDAFEASAVIVKMLVTTPPLQQWAVRRELLRRINKRFRALGIEVPYPHRVVFPRPERASGMGDPDPGSAAPRLPSEPTPTSEED